MSASLDIAEAVQGILQMPGVLPDPRIDVIRKRKHETSSEVESAIQASTLGLAILPPFPEQAMQGVEFVFVESAELRIRIVEQPRLNPMTVDAYELIDIVMTALHWQPIAGITKAMLAYQADHPGADDTAAFAAVQADPVNKPLFDLRAILAHPLQLKPRPTDELSDPDTRFIDVIFRAVYQQNSPGDSN